MLSINIDDVLSVLTTLRPYLIALGIIIVAWIILRIIVGKVMKKNPAKRRTKAGLLVALLAGICIVVNMICTGPMSTMLDLISGSGTISKETSDAATEIAVQIGEEGIALLENDDNILPMASGDKLNVFGWASINPILGGAGSGALNDAYLTTDILQSLSEAGIETNSELTQFYTDYKADRPEVGMWAQDWTLPEPNVSLYTDTLMSNAKSFSDTAMIVISRSGGEGADLPANMTAVVDGSFQDGTTYTAGVYDDTLNDGNDWDEGDHYLQLTNREEDMINLVCSNFDNVILVYNGANAFELGFVEDYDQIKGVLWTAGQGHVGMKALGEIVAGTVNPSAKLIDTYIYDFETAPWWNNFGDFNYENMDDMSYTSTGFTGVESTAYVSFVNYVEGIYVGYKFYETAAAEGLIDYEKIVQYPFGYGLSYTTFEQKMGDITEADGKITFDVTVTNTGSVAGKDVVEVYYNPPYTSGGIEKASANLVQFEKTGILEPGASETVNISFDIEDMASYDYKDAKGYVLEAGDYIISINSDSHNIIDSKTYTVASDIKGRSSDQDDVTNRFDFAEGEVTYLSRADGFANYEEATKAPADYNMTDEAKSTFYNISNYLTEEAVAADEDPDAEAITTGASNGITLMDMVGIDKDDAMWDQFMDQLTLDDMNALISLGGYQTNSVDSVGKIRTNDCDGPSSINNNFTGVGSLGFPVGVVISATFNKQLAHDFGYYIGIMADEMHTSGWYAPAMNIHRTAFAGRNFEYYSEDGVLSGYIAGNSVAGAWENGVYAYMKHFALNDQEQNRCDMLCTWTNEQALREIYLKPFEECVKDYGCLAVMSSFNYIGNRWAGGCSELLNDVLRGEWGFKGFVLTDYFGVYGYMSADQAIRNGTDMMLVNYPTQTNNVQFRDTNGAQQAMRQAAKNALYVVANSRAYYKENYSTAMPIWKIILYIADALVIALCCFIIVRAIKKKDAA
ncbi:MAG: glycoside hydrolase family 3 C-terminal domain-containing protein [Butyrivibrio sp.]|uniref:glycoside hydrolase family 3 N-terminal domain-containing protein n=1 Tax=Butyrivibrio sp. TaxID=28121 RepID=UPI0025E49724|nr:glycoside hydrolase family 3 N-terminal domain-containing protein [Butyrivibrio sp.]MCR5769944.1 glycoside hydrolase family 3 C-terminal domain-containing protein [Butyrivibrio sp.]